MDEDVFYCFSAAQQAIDSAFTLDKLVVRTASGDIMPDCLQYHEDGKIIIRIEDGKKIPA